MGDEVDMIGTYDNKSKKYNLQNLGISVNLNSRTPKFSLSDDKLKGYENWIREEVEGSDGSESVHYTRSRSPDSQMNFFMGALSEAMAFTDLYDVRSENPTQALDVKVDEFLLKHTGTDYQIFASNVDYTGIDTGDFAIIPKDSLKRRLFNFRAKAYLSALAATEEKGHDLGSLIKKIASTTIYPIKKNETEPVFDYVKDVLSKSL